MSFWGRLVPLGMLVAVVGTPVVAQQVVIGGGSGPLPAPMLPGMTATQPRPLEAGTGLIFGQTVDGDSGRPVAEVLVTLMVAGSLPVRVLTDGEGHYTFRDVPRGSFSVTATKPGYSDGAYGRLRPEGPTQPLQLAEGQRLTDVNLPLWRLSTIAGTVLDESGDPIVGATVRVLRRTLVGGQRQLQLGTSVTTDDRGMYRLSELVPGEYVVVLPMTPPTPIKGAELLRSLDVPVPPPPPGPAAGGTFRATFSVSGNGSGSSFIRFDSSGETSPAGLSDDGHELWYQTTFYPEAQSVARAEVIRLKAGEEHTSVDFTLKAVRTVSVSGTLTGPDGPVVSTFVTLVPADAADVTLPLETGTALTDSTGHFQFTRVPAGQYVIRAVKTPNGAAPAGDLQIFQMNGNAVMIRSVVRTSGETVPPLPTDPTEWIDAPVSVGTTDLADLGLSMRPGIRVSGRIEFRGTATQPTSDQYPTIGLSLVPADGRSDGTRARGRIEPTGGFSTMGVPAGKYVLQVSPPNGWLLGGAVFNGRDISDAAVDLQSADVEGVTITFIDKPSSIAGQVTTAAGSADSKAIVIVYPQDASLWTDFGPSPRRLRSTRTAPDGTYSLGVPAGDYNVVAVSDTGTFDWNDPQFLAAVASSAAHVTIGEGDKHQQPLRTIAPPASNGGHW